MEVLPMTRTEAVKEFFKKAVLPVAIAGLLYCIFKSACIRNGELDLLWLWILCGLPFGIHRMCVWIVPGGGSLGGGAALFVLNFVIGGLIGGFVLVWLLLVAAWYVAPHHLPPDRGITALWKCGKTAAPPMENRYSRPDGKAAGFPTAHKHRFPQLRKRDRLRTFPQRLLRRISILSF